jgi:DNA-binding XRE family transcriptional regulator
MTIASRFTMPTTTNPDYAALADQIRKKRRRLNLTQSQFARKIGVRQQQVSEWEQGKRLRLLSVAFRLARMLGK